jgi:hypothetical protein
VFCIFKGTNIEYASFEKTQIDVEPTYTIFLFFFLKKKGRERERVDILPPLAEEKDGYAATSLFFFFIFLIFL